METRKYKKGSVIINEGTSGDEFYIIKSGKVNVFKLLNGERFNLSTLKENECFGEMNFFLNKKRTASVEALEETEVFVLNESLFEVLIKTKPAYALFMIKKLVKHLNECHEKINELLGEKKSMEIIYGQKS